jgi:predicted DCC family thiol-disulfide oxidoreductase YuxK
VTRPVFLYDGDCAFCSSSARFIERRIPTTARVEAWQLADLETLGVTAAEAEAAVQWIAVDGTVASGEVAIARLLVDAGSFWRPLGWLIGAPPLGWVARPLYDLVARNRQRLPGGTATCSLPQAQRDAAKHAEADRHPTVVKGGR